jgi:hypothetical protein
MRQTIDGTIACNDNQSMQSFPHPSEALGFLLEAEAVLVKESA